MIPTESDSRSCSVVYLGLDDFPLGLAQTQKVRLFAKALQQQGCRVKVLSRWWSVGRWNEVPDLPPTGVYDGVSYIHACGHVRRPQGWFYRKYVRLRGFAREFVTIVRLRRSGSLDIAILSTWSSGRVLYYFLLSRVFRFPLTMHLVEYYSAYTANGTWKEKFNARILDQASLKLVDGVFPISTFLINRVEQYAPRLPWLRDPGLVDLSRYDGLHRKPANRYLVFCGYLGYMEVIRFCLHAFDQAKTDPDVQLHLVVNGSSRDFEQLEHEVKQLRKADRIVIHTGITDREVSEIYLSAYSLLIPLRQTDQDRARFPHKIGEYCGSGRPIITTNVGEIVNYFTHGVNAYIAQNYDLAEYAAAIEECLADPARARSVGAAGRKLAEETYHIGLFGPLLKHFVLNVAALRRNGHGGHRRLRAGLGRFLNIVNLSCGGLVDPSLPLGEAVDDLTSAGVVCVAAAESTGSAYQTIPSPDCVRGPFIAGSSAYTDRLADFSSRGPTDRVFVLKPYNVEPGVGLGVTTCGGGTTAHTSTTTHNPAEHSASPPEDKSAQDKRIALPLSP